MDDFLAFFIYVDEDLVKNLFGTVLSGYIDVRTIKLTKDRSFQAHMQDGASEGFNGEDREFKEERDGYKTKNYIDVDNCRKDSNWAKWFQADGYDRIEDSFTRIYGTLTFHNELYQNLQNGSQLNVIENLGTNISNLSCGSYVDLKGVIKADSTINYLDKVINILTSYTTIKLNKLLNNDKVVLMDYDVILNLLIHFRESLSKNSTQDVVMETDDGECIAITVKDTGFLNGTCGTYDKVNCNCRVFGKVLNLCNNDQKGISLLRKTCNEDYYEELLEDIEPYMELLRGNGIRVPCKPMCRITGNTMVVIPISIYH